MIAGLAHDSGIRGKANNTQFKKVSSGIFPGELSSLSTSLVRRGKVAPIHDTQVAFSNSCYVHC